MSKRLNFSLNKGLHIKDPQETVLGQKIMKESIILLADMGFESFTFKKLANSIDSTEASIYRYFENKYQLLFYLVSWYWEWVNYLIDFNTKNIDEPREQLRLIIKTIVSAAEENEAIDYINESVLHRVVVAEGAKVYHTKMIDMQNQQGLFINYKNLVHKVSHVITSINPLFPYPNALASNIFEMANDHIHFGFHLNALTNVKVKPGIYKEVEEMIIYFAFKLLDCLQVSQNPENN